MWREILIGAIGIVVASLIAVAVEEIFGALSSLIGPSVPRGAVVAFHGDCPKKGWESYQLGAGRFLLGFDKNDTRKERKLHYPGGSETHKLTAEEIPSHGHNQVAHGRRCSGECKSLVDVGQTRTSSEAAKAHQNMPPYLVVSFCKKT